LLKDYRFKRKYVR